MNADRTIPGDWFPASVPSNVMVADDAYLESSYSFEQFRSTVPDAVSIGRGSSVYQGVMFELGEQARASVGQYTLMNGARLICDTEITIGDYCFISWNVVIMDTYRISLNAASRRACLEAAVRRSPRRVLATSESRPICIGTNVWIGFDCCILPGATIGEGSVVGARSVVTGDIPPFSIAVGNPARVIRKLEPHEVKLHDSTPIQ
jgi:acetyltransferase-like isoleucine patch superfamily enzyme